MRVPRGHDCHPYPEAQVRSQEGLKEGYNNNEKNEKSLIEVSISTYCRYFCKTR